MRGAALRPLEFLRLVWGEEEGWVDLPSRVYRSDGIKWVPCMLAWPSAERSVEERIKGCVADGEDVYFSVCLFADRARREDLALPNSWLWADLDAVRPQDCGSLGVWPTIAWATSSDRYQGLWGLTDRTWGGNTRNRFNRALSAYVGADMGGWDVTQVLRVPGSRNFKRNALGEARDWEVRIVGQGKRYEWRELWKAVRRADTRDDSVGEGGSREKLAVVEVVLPAAARRLLSTGEGSVVVGERSSQLWRLECLLAESGLDEESIFSLVWDSVWAARWKEKGDAGRRGCQKEIHKAVQYVQRKRMNGRVKPARVEEAAGKEVGLEELQSFGRFLGRVYADPVWLVEGIWTMGSHGIIGGEPKTGKSTIAASLAMAVATGRPMWGKYAVGEGQPVVLLQEENAPWVMQDRLLKIAASYGIVGKVGGNGVIRFPDDVKLWVGNNKGLDLTQEEDRDRVEGWVKGSGAKLLVLDPLYLMMGAADVEKMVQLKPILHWILWLSKEYGCAVIVVHHMRKKGSEDRKMSGLHGGVRPGQRLLGSMALHGWLEAGLYATREADDGGDDVGDGGDGGDEEDGGILEIVIEREFRNVGPRGPMHAVIEMGPPGDATFVVKTGQTSYDKIVGAMEVWQSTGLAGWPLVSWVAEQSGLSKPSVVKVLKRRYGKGGSDFVLVKKGTGTAYEVRRRTDAKRS